MLFCIVQWKLLKLIHFFFRILDACLKTNVGHITSTPTRCRLVPVIIHPFRCSRSQSAISAVSLCFIIRRFCKQSSAPLRCNPPLSSFFSYAYSYQYIRSFIKPAVSCMHQSACAVVDYVSFLCRRGRGYFIRCSPQKSSAAIFLISFRIDSLSQLKCARIADPIQRPVERGSLQ